MITTTFALLAICLAAMLFFFAITSIVVGLIIYAVFHTVKKLREKEER